MESINTGLNPIPSLHNQLKTLIAYRITYNQNTFSNTEESVKIQAFPFLLHFCFFYDKYTTFIVECIQTVKIERLRLRVVSRRLTVPNTSLTSTDANSHERAGKLQNVRNKNNSQLMKKTIPFPLIWIEEENLKIL